MENETRQPEHKRKAKLLKELARCAENDDIEVAHADADDALIEFIDDAEISEAYNRIDKWYA